VQILTIESITEKIMLDPNLRINYINTLRDLIGNIIADPNIEINSIRLFTLIHDLKYMAKKDVLPLIISQTDFVE
jgi:hypothetical protein